MVNKIAARALLQDIENVRLKAALVRQSDMSGDTDGKMELVHIRLDEARLWLQDVIGYERVEAN